MILFTCAATIIINTSGFKWDDRDHRTFRRAVGVCKEVHDDCLKTFIKKKSYDNPKDFHYNAICGGKRESKEAKAARLAKERVELMEKITDKIDGNSKNSVFK